MSTDQPRDTTHHSVYEATITDRAHTALGPCTDPVFGMVFHVPRLFRCGDSVPTVSTVRFVEGTTVEQADPFAYDHPLVAGGSIRLSAKAGQFPAAEWDY